MENQSRRKEEKEREREKDVERYYERKKEEKILEGRRKIEKDCHARHSGGDEGGGVCRAVQNVRERKKGRE